MHEYPGPGRRPEVAQGDFVLHRIWRVAAACGLLACMAAAQNFGAVRGIVHDPQHRPVADATVVLHASASKFSETTLTNAEGEFTFTAVPVGEYTVRASHAGFRPLSQAIAVTPGTSPILHLPLELATLSATATVTAAAPVATMQSVTPTTVVNRNEVARTPGADLTNSVAMITDFVPGAYITHDQLHIRGGHQVSWLIDGVPIPNTNIAGNVGPQFNPQDVDYLETERGGYDASEGDRTYGVFDVVPRTGFERSREAELISSAGNYYSTNDELNFGSHTDRFAYYVGLNGNRSNLGLETPDRAILHDGENGYGAFGNAIFNADSANQLRLMAQARRDYYQIPNTAGQNAACPASPPAAVNGPVCNVHDAQRETDNFVVASWLHTFSPELLLTFSPFYHFNSADYNGGRNDYPIATTDDRGSSYVGEQTSLAYTGMRNSVNAGFYGFSQHDTQLLGLVFNDNSGFQNFTERAAPNGGLAAGWIEEKFTATSWLTLLGGLRETHFNGSVVENSLDPRLGASLRVPQLNWVLHGFWGKYYQAPPLITAVGPMLNGFAGAQQYSFEPLHGERDEEHQFGVTIPIRGWVFDGDNFNIRAVNFFDHNNIGNSDIFFPITITGARVNGWEGTLRSPRLWNRGDVHVAYSNQIAEGEGVINGGLLQFSPPSGWYLLDHDQRNTVNAGFDFNLPAASYMGTNVYYGSGFSNANPPPAHLPGHASVDVSIGRQFTDQLSASLTALNIANRRLLIDNSLTFGGTHYDNPRQVYVEFRYRFKY
jgi:hypothetical protein